MLFRTDKAISIWDGIEDSLAMMDPSCRKLLEVDILETLQDLSKRLSGPDHVFVLEKIGELVSVEHSRAVLHSGVIRALTPLLREGSPPAVQWRACRIFRRMMSNDGRMVVPGVVTETVLSRMVQLLCSADSGVRQEAMETLGHFSGCALPRSAREQRELAKLVNSDASVYFLRALDVFMERGYLTILRQIAQAMVKLCQSDPQRHLCLASVEVLFHIDDPPILIHVCALLHSSVDGNKFVSRAAPEPNRSFLHRLISLIEHPCVQVQSAALKLLNVVATPRTPHPKDCLLVTAVPLLTEALTIPNNRVKAEICGFIGRFVIHHPECIDELLRNGAIQSIIILLFSLNGHSLDHSGARGENVLFDFTELDSRRHLLEGLARITRRCTPKQIELLLGFDCMRGLCEWLVDRRNCGRLLAFKVLSHIFRAGEKLRVQKQLSTNPHVILFIKEGGLRLEDVWCESGTPKEFRKYLRGETILETLVVDIV
eukprot:Protomagalhaensia_wolfi_Nauph_80__5553@NODE_611_length_2211_cov_14_939687_g458_i0_p1_GENE_NODE_611_length_2211_cov_14_939687_g458_i0NODE_611_length_2211_cov_14_939687_g458_i0_p1_ORF_typecomplete_len486_score52_18HEAT_2/PF13646_6/0_00037HEAT_2/PF13646_6/18HEAT_2/PF13646_6/0_00064Arm/PF00514_23/3_6Arm/PF00514_23/0_67Arm/PF00514_23/59Arm/PF00514_23/2_6e02Arm/PF00514_23/84HEAT_EZ/PF13513_6/29HEAT_EZ/PF13513_6/10HEAT_EZ/PF13513_6/78HEAT_EZ/PF13513_6/31Proteasom_PSMB/PF10508_9/0_046Proteasom_PSMB/PF10